MGAPPLITRRRGVRLLFLALNGLLQACATLALASLGSRLLDGMGVVASTEVSLLATAPQVSGDPSLMMAGLVASALALMGLQASERRAAEAFALDYVRDLRTQLFRHIMAMPRTHPKLRFGLVMTRVINDLSAVKLWLSYGLAATFVAITVLTAVTAYLAFFAPGMALAFVPGIALWAAIVTLSTIPLGRAVRETRRERGRLAAFAGSALSARTTLAHFGRTGPTLRKIERQSDRMNSALVRRAMYSGLLRASSEALYPAMILALISGVASLSAGVGTGTSPETLSFIIVLTGLIALQLNSTARAADYRLGFREAMKRIDTILAEPTLEPEVRVERAGEHFKRCTTGRALTVEKVAVPATPHSASGEATAIFDFAIPAGGVLELDQHSSHLRSRLFEMIAGIEAAPVGRILIGATAIAAADRRDWRRTVTLLSPGLPLTRGTIDKNLALGAPSSTSAEDVANVRSLFSIDAKAIAGRASEKIGDDTIVDPDLAARIRAARAILREVSIVLIDDAAVQAEPQIMEMLLGVLQARGSTVVINRRT
jgi:ABC-type multidrug transport system fused ATPase/permease subunit